MEERHFINTIKSKTNENTSYKELLDLNKSVNRGDSINHNDPVKLMEGSLSEQSLNAQEMKTILDSSPAYDRTQRSRG